MGLTDDFALFDASLDRQPDRTRYPGKELHVLFDRRRCMHAAECGRASKQVFDGKRSPWIEPDHLAADALLRVVQRCPTGALRAVRPDGSEIADPVPPANEVTVCPDGPVYLRGDLEIQHPDGSLTRETRVALCRCGASTNKPYCDGAHARARFRDAGGVASDCDAPLEAAGTLRVSLATDGPVLLAGPHTVRAASGRPACAGDKAALCRCGHSANKPFCDGAHKRVGWRAIDGDGR